MEERQKQTCKILKWHKEELLELFSLKRKEIASGIYFVTLKLIPFLSYSLWMFFVKFLVNYAQMKKRILLQS